MIVGFTGTRRGMTSNQKEQLKAILEGMDIDSCHHGGCEGADTIFHKICNELEIDPEIHPGDEKQAHGSWGNSIIYPIKPYLERNKDIVDKSDVLIATPKSSEEEVRSGTWMTVRYARKKNKPVYVILP